MPTHRALHWPFATALLISACTGRGFGTDAGRIDDGGTASITCGGVTCSTGRQECCLNEGAATGACTARGTCTTSSVLACSDPAGCPGRVCCGELSTGALRSTCARVCPSTESTFRLCATRADCAPVVEDCRPAPGAGFFLGIRACVTLEG